MADAARGVAGPGAEDCAGSERVAAASGVVHRERAVEPGDRVFQHGDVRASVLVGERADVAGGSVSLAGRGIGRGVAGVGGVVWRDAVRAGGGCVGGCAGVWAGVRGRGGDASGGVSDHSGGGAADRAGGGAGGLMVSGGKRVSGKSRGWAG